MANLVEIAVPKGGTGSFTFTLVQGGAPINLSDKSLTFTVAPYAGGTPSFTKKNTAAGGDDAQLEITDAFSGVCKVKFIEADTLMLAHGVYVCDMWMDDAGTGEHIQVVALTPFRVKPRAKATT